MADINTKYPNLVKQYPAQGEQISDVLDPTHELKWAITDWSVGDPIDENKLDNIELGIAILMTRAALLEKEVGGDFVDQAGLNASRIDKLMGELWGTGDPATDDSRLDAIIDKVSTIAAELYGSDDTTLASRLDNIESELGGARAPTGYTSSRLDQLEAALQGTTVDGAASTTYSANRLDKLEAELQGITVNGATANSYTNSRLDNLESELGVALVDMSNDGSGYTTHGRLDALENKVSAINGELGGATLDGATSTYGGTTRLDSIIEEVFGTNDLTVVSRLDSLEAEIGGTRDGANGYTSSNIDKLDNQIAAIAAEIGGTAPDGTSTTYTGTTRIDHLINEVWGADIAENALTSTSSRIDDLETAIGTGSGGSTSLTSRIETLESTVGTTDSALTHEARLDAIESTLGSGDSGSNTIVSRVAALETSNAALATEIGGTFSGTQYSDSRIDVIEGALWASGSTPAIGTTKYDGYGDRITALENSGGGGGGGGTATINLVTTTDTSATDNLTVAAGSLVTNTITFVLLSQNMVGAATAAINGRDIYVNGAPHKLTYRAGALLGLYVPAGQNYVYLFNAPVII